MGLGLEGIYIKEDLIFHHAGAVHHGKGLGHALHAQGFAVFHQEQRGAALIAHAAAIEPERNLIKDLVVFFIGIGLVHLAAFLVGHPVVVGLAGIDAAQHHEMSVIQLFNLLRCKGQGEEGLRLTAAQIQHIVAGEGFLGLGAFLFLG